MGSVIDITVPAPFWLNMYLHYFALFLLGLTVNGAPKPNPKPNPKADPRAKAQMAIIFNNNKHGDTGMSHSEYGEYYSYGEESGGNRLNLGCNGVVHGSVGVGCNGDPNTGGWHPQPTQRTRQQWGNMNQNQQWRPRFSQYTSYFG